jgi:ADP-heptose:LPS heptosyltransferase
MQRLSTPARDRRPRLLVVELWGLGDLALAMPFLRTAARHAHVTLLAKPHAAPLLQRFAPDVELVPLVAPWTAFTRKYELLRWPWRELAAVRTQLQWRRFDAGVSARRDPRDHAVLATVGAALRAGFAHPSSRVLLTDALAAPANPHRAAHWAALAAHFGWEMPTALPAPRTGRRVVIHPGAAQPVREWPLERFQEIARRLTTAGWDVDLIDASAADLDALLARLAAADRFIGNDSGPGHLAALLGVPTFTIFGPQLPELFAPQHPRAAWIDGAACNYKPCFDACRFGSPHCIRELTVDDVWSRVERWVGSAQA